MEPFHRKNLDQLFTKARTGHAWRDRDVPASLLRELYDLVKFAPTCVNGAPARFRFVVSPPAKTKLVSTLLPKNVGKTLAAPVTVIIAEDLNWYEELPRLMPHADYRSHFASDLPLAERTCFRNSSMQGAYLILAARARS